ncbi:MAG: DUF4255 domain-containing protein [Caldilineaceae bacterium]|nr:DUF4255 domain-containing protein [Caldilineaceae bacterium]
MFDDVDEALRVLLVREIPVRGSEIEIAFEQPKREWSARLNRPTLNVFMHDLRENIDLRSSYQHHGKPTANGRNIVISRPTHRFDLHYLITSWASEPDDEHRLLGRALLALLRVPELHPATLSGTLIHQPVPLQLRVSQYESHLTPLDIWGVLDNEMRPALMCTVTLSLDPHLPIEVPAVRSRQLRVGDIDALSYRRQTLQSGGPVRFIGRPRNIAEETEDSTGADADRSFIGDYWTVGGQIQLSEDAKEVYVVIVQTGQEIPVAADGRFVIGNLRVGAYTLSITVDGQTVEREISVPSAAYEVPI